MLGKLMKYEFMSMGRIFLPIYGALLAMAIISRLLMLLPNTHTPGVLGTLTSSLLIAATAVITLILILQRFYKNLLTNEGYLMMTLPVKTDWLILSKLFVATIFSIASYTVIILAIFILSSSDFRLVGFEFLAPYQNFQSVLIAIEVLVLIILAIFASVLLLYLCMALSLLVNKRRILFSFGMYVAITTVLQILTVIAVAAFGAFHSGRGTLLFRTFSEMSAFATSQVILLTLIAITFGICATFYLITRYMLRWKLNLQ